MWDRRINRNIYNFYINYEFFEIIVNLINVIDIMLWVYGYYTILTISVRGTTLDVYRVRFWRLKSVPELKGLDKYE